jgi:hypothetical protein
MKNTNRKNRFHRILPYALLMAISGCSSIEKQQAQATALLQQQAEQYTGQCNSPADSTQAQYIIGYGSLMQEASRKRTAPNADTAYPVEITGYRRGWFAKGSSTGFSTTFLGVVPDENSQFNAVIFGFSADELLAMDKRESGYCRRQVDSKTVHLYGKGGELPEGQYWIYSNSSNSIAVADSEHPLVQSYIDIFVGGCLEQQERFSLTGFSEACIGSTTDWSANWVNDRIHPRRPFAAQPLAGKIDTLLEKNLPELFRQIRLE